MFSSTQRVVQTPGADSAEYAGTEARAATPGVAPNPLVGVDMNAAQHDKPVSIVQFERATYNLRKQVCRSRDCCFPISMTLSHTYLSV